MRSVNHYNAPAAQRRILERILAALKPGGHLATQNLSGPSAAYCAMVSTIARLTELGRVAVDSEVPHIAYDDEFNGFMIDAGFADVGVVGRVPEIEVGPAYYWARFNGLQHKASLDDHDVHAVIHERQRAYMARANAIIDDYRATAPGDDAAPLRPLGRSWVVPLWYPVHVGRWPS